MENLENYRKDNRTERMEHARDLASIKAIGSLIDAIGAEAFVEALIEIERGRKKEKERIQKLWDSDNKQLMESAEEKGGYLTARPAGFWFFWRIRQCPKCGGIAEKYASWTEKKCISLGETYPVNHYEKYSCLTCGISETIDHYDWLHDHSDIKPISIYAVWFEGKKWEQKWALIRREIKGPTYGKS